ncbi:hypothetical protein RvY_17941 [Ramazzottius varieornatus]|uniref:Dynactin subunit 6 n=1 Tax=Ramazzottius varieornatus TaxID=947166 RepID=A0A1D1W3Z4_RAMVA|nr:hypothetical protein RvY_17941 [Ramazzottius varieornatus]
MSTVSSQGSAGSRSSVTTPAPAASLNAPPGVIILAKAIVARESELQGQITIGGGTIVHPSARILAENGPIVIGDGNIIEERVTIRNVFPVNEDGSSRTLYIGSKNLFETFSVTEGNIGDLNTISCKARVGKATTLRNGCVVGVSCAVDSAETIPDNMFIYRNGENIERRTSDFNQTPPSIDDHLEFLQKQLPNYHYILKTST